MRKSESTRSKKNVKPVPAVGYAVINSTFNNTIISIADEGGNVVSWSSAGSKGFKGSRKSTPYAAQVAADDAADPEKNPHAPAERTRDRDPSRAGEEEPRAEPETQ